MGDFKINICRLCLNVIENDVLEIIDEVPRNVFDILLLKLNLDENTQHLMCSTCSKKLYAAFDFKSTCLSNESKFIANQHSRDKLNDREICRLCLKLICGDFTPLPHVEVDVIQRYVPELDFNLGKDPVVCQTCLQSLETHSSFVKSCLDMDEKINNFFYVKNFDSQQNELSSNTCVQTVNEMVKNEEVIIKTEKEDEMEEQLIESEICEIKCEVNEHESAEFPHLQALSEACEIDVGIPIKINSSGVWYECQLCPYKSTRKGNLIRHKLRHRSSLEEEKLHKCNSCAFKTNHKVNLERHLLVHKDPSEVQWFQCTLCDYRTKHKRHLKPHMLVHKSPSEIEWHECNFCEYKAKTKKLLATHLLSHEYQSEIPWQECDSCEFKAKYKALLVKHKSEHKPPKAQWHRCGSCSYRTKQEQHLEWHMLKHKTAPEQSWFECGVCGFKVRHKKGWERHKLIHKDPSEVRWYECNSCDYKAKWKHCLQAHMLTHKSPSQIEWFKCDMCDYKVKHKKSLTLHLLGHNAPSEIKWHECHVCSYKAKRKASLKRHMWVAHKEGEAV